MKTLTLEDLLSRINLRISLDDVAQQVAKRFDLGNVITISPLFVGYEELNTLLVTNKGKFLVKIFSKDKDLKTIQSNVDAIDNFYRGNVPVPKLYKDNSGKFLYELDDNHGTYLIVMDYVDGHKFTEIDPTMGDFIALTEILTRIHNLPIFHTDANFDMWLPINLVDEFAKKKKYLNPDEYELINPIVDEFKTIDFDKLNTSIVHFDLHRENAMKDTSGKYAILDLSSCTESYSILDVATFIALFCFDYKKSFEEHMHAYSEIKNTYLKFRPLNEYEQHILPLLIRVTLASNLLIPCYVQQTNQDSNPEQTLYYKSLGENGLKMLKDWKN